MLNVLVLYVKMFHNLIVAHQNSNLFENHQTVVQTIKPHHTRSNSLHNSLYCANCCANNQTTPHMIKQFAQQSVLRKLLCKQTTPHTIQQFAQQPVLRKLLCKQSNHTTHDQTICTTACIVQTVRPCMGPLNP